MVMCMEKASNGIKPDSGLGPCCVLLTLANSSVHCRSIPNPGGEGKVDQ